LRPRPGAGWYRTGDGQRRADTRRAPCSHRGEERATIAVLMEDATHWEARARGRESFWHGRPLWTNPLTGRDAREWTRGWQDGLADLSRRRGLILSASAAETAEWHALLVLYRPADVMPTPRRRRAIGPKVSRATRAMGRSY
jgi:hypothetical protein